MRGLTRAAEALPEGAFPVVMATGIVSLACRHAVPVVSGALLCLGVGAFVVVGLLVGWRRGHGGSTRAAAWWDVATFVAAAATLAAGLRVHGYGDPATGLDAVAIVAWLWLVLQPAPWVSGAKGRRPEDVSGRRLLAVVATQSAVISAAGIARSGHDTVLGVVALSAWAMGMVIYVPMVIPVAQGIVVRTRTGLFRADDWIAMGALAISALAADALLRIPAEPLRPEIRVLGVAGWAAACLLIPPLVRLDLAPARRWHWPPGAGRWSMVFPLGMFSAACQALGGTASFPAMAQLGRVMAWVAIPAWVLVATGCAVRAATIAKGTTLRAGPTVGA